MQNELCGELWQFLWPKCELAPCVWGSLVQHDCGKQVLVQCWLKWDSIFDTVNPAKILDPYFQANENLMKNACEEVRLEMEQNLWNI